MTQLGFQRWGRITVLPYLVANEEQVAHQLLLITFQAVCELSMDQKGVLGHFHQVPVLGS